MRIRFWGTLVTVLVLLGCGGADDPSHPADAAPDLPPSLVATFGTYNISCTTSITRSDGTSLLLGADKAGASLEISGGQPGVMGIDPGTTVPGVDPQDVIFGAAYVQNPVHVFVGTATADQDGDFGIWSSVWYGIPADAVDLQFTGCQGVDGPFACSPQFFEAAEMDDSVNLIYFATSVTEYADGDIRYSGTLVDDHRSEAAAANGFSLQADHDILGPGVYPYLLDEGATFEFTFHGAAVSGSLTGTGRALISSEPDVVTFSVNFGGTKGHRGP